MTQARPLNRALPVLDLLPAEPVTPRAAPDVADQRLAEYRPDERALPAFHMWTLGCQMNRSNSEEMAGRLLAAGCAEAPSMEAADLIVINTCAIREGAEQKVIGRQGHLARLKEANPGLRVVLTGCSVREPHRDGLGRRYPAVDLFLRPDEEPELVDRLGLASAQAPIGAVGATRSWDGPWWASPTTWREPGHEPSPRARSLAGPRSARGCRSSTAATRRARTASCRSAAARSAAARSTRSSTRRGRWPPPAIREVTLLGQNVNSYGHDLPPEPRFAHVDAERWAGRKLDLHGRPDLAELIRAIDALRSSDGRAAIPRLRFVTSHPWDLSDRLVAALADCRSVCEHLHLPVQSGDDAVLRRMGRQYTIEHYLERLAAIRVAVPGISISTDVIVGFCGETREQFEATLRLLETVRYDQVFAAAYSVRPGTPATKLADDVPPAEKRERLNELLALQESIGLERNRAWLDRDVEVLVDTVVPPRSHEHEDANAAMHERDADGSALSGRTRGNKLVHLRGETDLVGRFATVRVEHAGPYALRGTLDPRTDG